jgi:hypothetical protein
MSEYHATHVTLIGHSLGEYSWLFPFAVLLVIILTTVSLGGALALLDSIFLPLHLPPGTTFRAVTYGMPRVCIDAAFN